MEPNTKGNGMNMQPVWNFDLATIPKSHEIFQKRMIRGALTSVRSIQYVWIIAAFPGGKQQVGRTRWLPEESRWEGMTKKEQPVAYIPWPEFPEIDDESAVFG